MVYSQQEFDIKLEWGQRGLQEILPVSDVVIMVDILSFSTCVDIATRNGALVFPYRWKDDSAMKYANSLNAELADFERRSKGGFSLSPTSLLQIRPETKLVLPSPNGSTLSLATEKTPTLCGGLTNAKAVAKVAESFGKKISIIAAGEQWPDKSLRVAFEDLVGAGAIISYLRGILSPEAKVALGAFEHSKNTLLEEIKQCSSGKELIVRGFEQDIILACQLNLSNNVPILKENFYESYYFQS